MSIFRHAVRGVRPIDPPPPGGGGRRSLTEGEVTTTAVAAPLPSPSAPPPAGGGESGAAHRPRRNTFVGPALALVLSACGLQPLYSGGNSSPVVATLGAVEVAPIEGRGGWLVANAVRDRLQAAGSATPRYRLDIRLDDQIVGLGIRRDDSVTRERRTLRARYQLVDLASGTAVIDATAGSDAGIDVVSSEYATIAAESSALERLSQIVADQIVAQVALHARREGAAAPK